MKKIKEYNIVYLSSECTKFSSPELQRQSVYDKYKQYESCPVNNKLHLDNGRLYRCDIAASINIFNNYFKNNQIPYKEEDSLDLYKINSAEDIAAFMKTPSDLCSKCNYRHQGNKNFIWHKTEYKASEWAAG